MRMPFEAIYKTTLVILNTFYNNYNNNNVEYRTFIQTLMPITSVTCSGRKESRLNIIINP